MDINDNNKFFRYVWRFNALAIACAVVLGFVLCSYAAIKVFKRETRERHVTNVVNLEGQTKVKDEFVFDYPYMVVGTDYLRVALFKTQSYDMSYFPKSSGRNEVNYLFLNTRTGESKWMLQTTAQLFISDTVLLNKLEKSNQNENRAIGIVYTVAEKDTNGDNRLSGNDTLAVSFSSPDGSGYKKLVEGVDRLYAIKQIADDKMIIFYEKNKETICEIYQIPSMKKVSHTITKLNL